MKRRATAPLATLGLVVLALLVVPPLRAEADWLITTLYDTRDAYAAYTANRPLGRHGAEALAREDDRSWQLAEGLGTIAAYQGYLQSHADGAYASVAIARIDDLAWADALAERSVASLERYLLAYPAGRHLEQARATLEEVRWHDAYTANAVEPALAYVRAYPDGRFAAAAASHVDGMRWMEAVAEDTPDAFERYLRAEPTGRFRAQAEARIEDLAWEAAVRAGTRDALEAVLARWPAGRYVEQARTLIDDLQWRAAVARGTLRAYRDYLRTAERGLHAAEARARIAALPAPLPNMAYAGQTQHQGAVRLVTGPGSIITSARISLRGIDQPDRPDCRLTVWQDDPQRGLAFGDYPDVAIVADDLPLPIRDGRIAYTPERPRTVPAVLAGGSFAFRIGSNPLPAGSSVTMQLVQVAVRGEFRADRLEGTIQPVFPGLPGCDGPAVPFSAVAFER